MSELEDLQKEIHHLRSALGQSRRAAREWMRSASRPSPAPYVDAEDAVLEALDRLHHHDGKLLIDGIDSDEPEPDLPAIATAVLAALGYRKEDHDIALAAARRRVRIKLVRPTR